MPLTQKLEAFMKDRKWQEADKVADELLALIEGKPRPEMTKPRGRPVSERLPAKIQEIQKDLPAWIQKTGRMKEASALMKTLDGQIKTQDFEGAEKTADSILKMIGQGAPAAGRDVPEETRK